MPCVTGRAGHTLLKKDCQSGCACCVNSTYSCGLLKCDEPLINEKKPDVSGLVCELIKESAEVSCETGLSFLQDLTSLPEKHCRFRVERRNVTQSVSLIFEVEDRILTEDPNNDNSVSNDDVLTYFVNGVECLTCTD